MDSLLNFHSEVLYLWHFHAFPPLFFSWCFSNKLCFRWHFGFFLFSPLFSVFSAILLRCWTNLVKCLKRFDFYFTPLFQIHLEEDSERKFLSKIQEEREREGCLLQASDEIWTSWNCKINSVDLFDLFWLITCWLVLAFVINSRIMTVWFAFFKGGFFFFFFCFVMLTGWWQIIRWRLSMTLWANSLWNSKDPPTVSFCYLI